MYPDFWCWFWHNMIKGAWENLGARSPRPDGTVRSSPRIRCTICGAED